MDANATLETFELLWKSGRRRSIEFLLSEASEDERQQLVKDLVIAEVRLRVANGERPRPSEYLERFPPYASLLKDDLERECESVRNLQSTITNAHVLNDSAESSLVATGDTRIERPLIAGRYRLNELLGRGGFGEVWKAFDPELNRSVAVKLTRTDKNLSESEAAQLLSEGRKLGQLRHPGIIHVFDAGRENGQLFLVSEYVAGGTLASRMRLEHLKPEEAARLLAGVAEALHHAHLRDLVHRDLKPSNILLDEEGSPRIADFGLAVSEREQLCETSSTLGTYAYMSPEQLRGESNRVDARSDIYSLGVILYELLTDRLPYLARTPEQWVQQVLEREPRPPRTIDDRIPPALEQVCLKCLAKPMDQRYTTALDLACALRAALTPPRPAAAPLRTLGWITIACATLLIAWLTAWQYFFPPSAGDKSSSSNSALFPAVSAVESRRPAVDSPLVDVRGLPVKDWHELFREPPRIAVWPANPKNAKFDFDSLRRELWIDCSQTGMFSLGRADTDFDFQATVHQSSFDGGFGLFWGLHADPEHGPTAQRYQVVWLRPTLLRGNRVIGLHHELNVDQRGTDVVSESVGLVSGALTSGEQVLQISIRGGRLVKAQWGDQETEPTSAATLKFGMPSLLTDDSQGEFGVIIRSGSATFRSAYVRRP